MIRRAPLGVNQQPISVRQKNGEKSGRKTWKLDKCFPC